MHVDGTCWDCIHGYGVLNPPCSSQKADPREKCAHYERIDPEVMTDVPLP